MKTWLAAHAYRIIVDQTEVRRVLVSSLVRDKATVLQVSAELGT